MIRADFACLSVKCRTPEGEAMVHEIAFEGSRVPTHCPMCGSKRLRRLFNAVNVIGAKPLQPDFDPRLTSSSKTVIKDALMRPGFDHADKAAQDPRKRLSTMAVPNGQFSAYSGMGGQGRPMTEMERAAVKRRDPHPIHVSNIVGPISRQPIPTSLQGRG